MSRIVVAWELGENLGHLWSLLPVAQRLQSLGHDIMFGMRDMEAAHRYLAPSGFRWFAAPTASGLPTLGREAASHTDILAACGAGHPAYLEGMVGAWRHLYEVLEPDLVLVEHAPFGLLAAKCSGIPVIHLGTGFTIPPTLTPAPNFRPWGATQPGEIAQTQERVLSAVQGLFRQPLSLDDALRADATRLLSIPELDHYRAQRPSGATFIGPMPAPWQYGEVVSWLRSDVPHVFVYLHAAPWLDAVLHTLNACDAEVIAMLPDVAPAFATRYPNLRCYGQPVRLDGLLATCSLAITHGGHGTALTCLLAGVPMLVLPTHIEQLRVAENVAEAGAGLGILPAHVVENFGSVFRALINAQTYRDASRAIAARYHVMSPERALNGVADLVEQIVSARAPKA